MINFSSRFHLLYFIRNSINADAHDGARLERGVDRLIKLRDANMMLYKECKIPTDWMLDSSMVNKVQT